MRVAKGALAVSCCWVVLVLLFPVENRDSGGCCAGDEAVCLNLDKGAAVGARATDGSERRPKGSHIHSTRKSPSVHCRVAPAVVRCLASMLLGLLITACCAWGFRLMNFGTQSRHPSRWVGRLTSSSFVFVGVRRYIKKEWGATTRKVGVSWEKQQGGGTWDGHKRAASAPSKNARGALMAVSQ